EPALENDHPFVAAFGENHLSAVRFHRGRGKMRYFLVGKHFQGLYEVEQARKSRAQHHGGVDSGKTSVADVFSSFAQLTDRHGSVSFFSAYRGHEPAEAGHQKNDIHRAGKRRSSCRPNLTE